MKKLIKSFAIFCITIIMLCGRGNASQEAEGNHPLQIKFHGVLKLTLSENKFEYEIGTYNGPISNVTTRAVKKLTQRVEEFKSSSAIESNWCRTDKEKINLTALIRKANESLTYEAPEIFIDSAILTSPTINLKASLLTLQGACLTDINKINIGTNNRYLFSIIPTSTNPIIAIDTINEQSGKIETADLQKKHGVFFIQGSGTVTIYNTK